MCAQVFEDYANPTARGMFTEMSHNCVERTTCRGSETNVGAPAVTLPQPDSLLQQFSAVPHSAPLAPAPSFGPRHLAAPAALTTTDTTLG